MGRRTVALAALVFLGLLLFVWRSPALWLDEAQSVSFARLPLTAIPHALRQDGAPPLYYMLLHLWMRLFGDGDVAVRSLSALCAAGFVAALAVLADRLAGKRGAVAAAVLAATNPFVLRYATETRMYTLVMLEVALGALALVSVLRNGPGTGVAALAVATAALMYTHYWSLYLVAATAAVLAAVAVRRPPVRPALVAIAAGGTLWLPWLPSFLFQSRHTGTPWRGAPAVSDALRAIFLPRGESLAAVVLAVILLALVATAAAGRPTIRLAVIVFAIGVALAFIGAAASSSAFAPRYTAAFVPLLLLCAAAGVAAMSSRPQRAGVLALLAVLGGALALANIGVGRTRAPRVAAAILQDAKPGDVVVYCPDQLGPAVSRLLDRAGTGIDQLTFPAGSTAERVDWIDYAQRYRAADIVDGAEAIADRAGSGATIWLVWSDVYPPTQPVCRRLRTALAAVRPRHRQVLTEDVRAADHDALWRYDPTSSPFPSIG